LWKKAAMCLIWNVIAASSKASVRWTAVDWNHQNTNSGFGFFRSAVDQSINQSVDRSIILFVTLFCLQGGYRVSAANSKTVFDEVAFEDQVSKYRVLYRVLGTL
jgi:hypothetical protein